MKKKNIKIGIIIASVLLIAALAVVGGLFLLGNRETSYTNKANVEWYDENGEEFIISTPEELYGVLALSEYYDFKGQTIKLGADIVMNEGSAEDWKLIGPENRWYPITGFAGTFDGQGHSISGLYAKGSNINLGLFADTDGKCVIKNFKILNSYFKVNGNFAIGSVSANGSGTFSNIYSDAILSSNGTFCGGLFGTLNVGSGNSLLSGNSKVSNCWFDGEIILTTKDGRYGGGIVGSLRGGSTEMMHCLNTGTISSESNHDQGCRIGGLIGEFGYVNGTGTLRMEDCLNAGKVKTVTEDHTGAIIGTIGSAKCITNLRNTYATTGSATKAFGYDDSEVTGTVRFLNEELVKGTDWYRYSSLDFDLYWAVVEDGAPALKAFVDNAPSLAGIEKGYDISWFNEEEDSFELTTKEQLIGLSLLSQDHTFEGKTIRLGADIVLNEGTKKDWLEKTPFYIWTPIGNGLASDMAFAGTFDGQGHTISGLYRRSGEKGIGLFKSIGGSANVKNLKITNSYFEYNGGYDLFANLGSVAGRCYGNLDTVYSDATLVTIGQANGGMVGQIFTSGFCTISNCWYDGELALKGNHSKGGRMSGGIVGRIESGQTTIQHCLFSGKLSSETINTGVHIGGFVGYARYASAGELVKVNIKDSLMSGTVDAVYHVCVGSVMGRAFEQVTVNMSETYVIRGNSRYTVKEKVTEAATVGLIDKTGKIVGGATNKTKEQMTGYNGYIWSVLDFDNYWAVDLKGTPILQSFASTKPSLSKVSKMIDTKWYDATKDTYTIKNVKELYGLAELASGTTNFAGKTVKLAADIIVNDGNAAEWAKTEPKYSWLPIGSGVSATQGFSGVFDGQGHTISGLYYKSGETGIGLFKALGEDALVKNVEVTNSYFEYTGGDRTTAAIGGVVGRSYGDIDTVYSNAIVKSTGLGNGGIVGQIYGDESTTINNTWFDGKVEMIGSHADGGQHGGGIVGRIERGAVNITHCLSSGLVSVEATGTGLHAGGFVGYIRYEKKDDGTKLNVSDCLMTGTVEGAHTSVVGSTIGRVYQDVTANLEKTYALKNTCVITKDGKVSYGSSIGMREGTVKGGVIIKTDAHLNGNNGFMYTELDFQKYWAVDREGTPVLQSFAGEIPATAGLAKLVDTSWYDATKKELRISTMAQFYGFADIVSGIDEFKGKKVVLTADITDNAGTVEEWKERDFANIHIWEPIGNLDYPFRGDFDGKGHTISGLYMNGNGRQALFARAYDNNVTIQNFSLKNTYIRSTSGNNGSIAGVFRGNMNRIYSDAEIVVEAKTNTGRHSTGGFVGYIDIHDTKFDECWFDGKITTNAQDMGGIFGRQSQSQTTTIENCLVTATLMSEVMPSNRNQTMGGFVGTIHGELDGGKKAPKLEIKSSIFAGTIDAKQENANLMGLMVAQTSGQNKDVCVEITKSYATAYNGLSIIGDRQGVSNVIGTEVGNMATVGHSGINNAYRKSFPAISVWNQALGLSDSTWCDALEGIRLRAFSEGRECIDTSWYDKTKDTFTVVTKAQLYSIARINEADANAFTNKTIVLGADINVNNGTVDEWKANNFDGILRWEPIGRDIAFRGNFKGQGHTISGLYMKGDTRQGLFGRAYGSGSAVINIGNFDLKNTYIRSTGGNNGSIACIFRGNLTSVYSDAIIDVVNPKPGTISDRSTGGMIGHIDTINTTLANCWYAGTITTDSPVAGGLVGIYVNNVTLDIENCLVSGTIKTNVPTKSSGFTNAACGGFIGVVKDNAKSVSLKNSLFTGSIEPGALTNQNDKNRSHVGMFVGQSKAANCTFTITNSYYPTNAPHAAIGYIDASGKINGTTYSSNSEKNTAIQNISKKWTTGSTVASLGLNTNVWKNTANGPVLLLNGNEEGRIRIDITWFEPISTTFTIMNKEQLFGLSYLNNQRADGTFRNKTVKLGADITVNEGTVAEWKANDFANLLIWEPVGNVVAYRGSFDGQGHTISGIYMNGKNYQSLFGKAYADNITLKNFRLVNTYITSNGTWAGSVASILRGTIDSVYSDAEIVIHDKTGDTSTGGILGYVDTAATTLSNCWYAGNITTTAAATGGLVGFYDTNVRLTIENCLMSGTVTTNMATRSGGLTNAACGGFIGVVKNNAPNLVIKNSLMTGTVAQGPKTNASHGNRSHIGMLVGQMNTTKCAVTITDSYYIKGGAFTPIGYIDASGQINGTSYANNATKNAALKTLCEKWTKESTVTGLGLNTSAWVDSSNGPVLKKFLNQ